MGPHKLKVHPFFPWLAQSVRKYGLTQSHTLVFCNATGFLDILSTSPRLVATPQAALIGCFGFYPLFDSKLEQQVKGKNLNGGLNFEHHHLHKTNTHLQHKTLDFRGVKRFGLSCNCFAKKREALID